MTTHSMLKLNRATPVANLRRGERGTIFLTTMVSMFLMVVTGGFLFQVSAQDAFMINKIKQTTQAQMLAEAGLSDALGTLRNDWASRTNAGAFPSTALGEGSFDASVATVGGRTLVTSVGTVNGRSRTVTAEVTPPGLSALDYVFAGGGDVEVDAGTSSSPGTINGDIYSGGEIDLDGPSTGGVLAITGDIDCEEDIDVGSNTTVTGTQTENFSTTVTFPTVDFSYYRDIAVANSYYYAADVTFDASSPIPSAPAGGVIYVNGNITINGAHSTTSCIVATGDIIIGKDGSTYPMITVNAPTVLGAKYPAMFCGGDFTFSTTGNASPDSYLTIDGLVYPQGNFTFTSGNHTNLTITGSVLARGEIDVSPTSFTLLGATYGGNATPPGFTSGAADMEVVSYNK